VRGASHRVPKGLKRVVRDHLEKARAAALAAVEAYNKPGSHFRTAHYIVMMTMAWTALFHANRFRNQLPDELINDPKYSFRVYLVPKVTTKPTSGDVAVEFVPYNPKVPEEVEGLKRLTALIKERQVPVANLGFLKASQVAAQVRARTGMPFNLSNHVNAWQHYDVRPGGGSEKPEKTKAKYCVYDTVHKDYVYTQEWVELVCKELADPAKYEAVTGRTLPQAAPQAAQPVEQTV
jgi:hypothetical protein